MSLKLFDLHGKVALVTGGGRGIGKFISRGFAEAGADLAIASRKVQNCQELADELKKLGVRTLAVQCDMAKVEDIERLVDTTMKAFGRIDILVNNAGMSWGAPTLEYPLDKWEKTMAVNLRGPFLLSQRVAKIMIAQKGGKIINLASVMSFRGAEEDLQPAVAYNAAKGAMATMTKDLAVKWAKYNIQVNALAPGYIGTDMMAWTAGEQFKAIREKMFQKIPMGRVGGEEDIKGVAVFLASAAADYVTGAIIPVDGGYMAW